MADIRTDAADRPMDNRLRPEMASFRLLALRFVRQYIADYGMSPSQGEIARGLDATRTRVRDALKSLAADGLLLRTPGERGLRLPDEREAALQTLRALGYRVEGEVVTDEGARPVSTLPAGPELDYP